MLWNMFLESGELYLYTEMFLQVNLPYLLYWLLDFPLCF